jgi:hypothetical protein
MTDKQILVLNKLVDLAKGVTGINYAGLYPEAVGKIGQRFPAVIVRDGDESAAQYHAGQEVIYDYSVDVILHVEIRLGVTRIADVLSLQNDLITAIITDLSLAGLVYNITGHSVSKGDDANVLADTASGYQGEITARAITFNFQIQDTRS